MMSIHARQEYVRQVSKRYLVATRPEKSSILDEFCRTTGYNRKYAVGVLRQPPAVRAQPLRRPRATTYTPAVKRELLTLWKASGCVCGKRLAPFVGPLLEALERAGEIDLQQAPSVRERLLGISAASIDRLLSEDKCPRFKGAATTKPGTLLRHQIPVRTFSDWSESEQKPGFCEVDLVAHCAGSTAGEFLYTLNFTDLFTGWTVPVPVMNRGEHAVRDAIKQARALLPFPLLGIDSDNGGEFINALLLRYCQQEKITFTRCRPYHKNDQCHVEQKNWTVVRQVVGYSRLEGVAAYNQLARLYQSLRLHVNFFQPSLKLVGKERVGARVKKTYDKAQTPYQRVLASAALPKQRRAMLEQLYGSLNPLELVKHIYSMQAQLERIAVVPGRSTGAEKHFQSPPTEDDFS